MQGHLRKAAGILLLVTVTAIVLPAFGATQAVDTPGNRSVMLEWQAATGDARTQFALGSMYSRSEEHELAALWWRKAAEQGLAEAQNELGAALADGRGVPKDQKQALGWYQKAADQGLAVAQANVALTYWNGQGVHVNPALAVDWFRKAADQDLGWAQFYLGDAYSRGRGVRLDYAQAVEWYRKAALKDYVDAQNSLGAMYFRGRGVERDNVEAVRWFALSARQGNETARGNLQRVAGALRRVKLHAAVAVRERPDPAATVLRTAAAGEYAYLMRPEDGWMQVYLMDGYAVGYIDADQMRQK